MKNITETHPSLENEWNYKVKNVSETDEKGIVSAAILKTYSVKVIQKHTIDKAVLRDIIYSKNFYEDIVKEIEKLLGDEE